MLSRSTRVELGCRFAIKTSQTLLQVRNFIPCILSLIFEKAIINAISLGLNLVLEFISRF